MGMYEYTPESRLWTVERVCLIGVCLRGGRRVCKEGEVNSGTHRCWDASAGDRCEPPSPASDDLQAQGEREEEPWLGGRNPETGPNHC